MFQDLKIKKQEILERIKVIDDIEEEGRLVEALKEGVFAKKNLILQSWSRRKI